MQRVTSRAAAAVAAASLVVGIPLIVTPAALANELPQDATVQTIEDALADRTAAVAEAAAPAAAPAEAKPNFTSRTAAALRATRSSSLYRFGTPTYAQWYAKQHIAVKYRWGATQYQCLVSLWAKESHWRYQAKSRNGKWYGIPQTTRFTIKGAGITLPQYMKHPELQIQVGAKYIKYRYNSPCSALKHSSRRGWY